MSLVGGLAEAVFLVVVTGVAFALSDSNSAYVHELWGMTLSVNTALVIGGALVITRLGLALAASIVSARLATDVVLSLRERTGTAFFGASWETQQRQRSGSLQELLSRYSDGASAVVANSTQIVTAGANLVAMVTVAVVIDPLGALVLITTVGVLGTLLRPLRALIRRRSQAASQAKLDYATSVNEVAELGLEMQVFDVESAVESALIRKAEVVRDADRSARVVASIATPTYTGLAYIAVLGALAAISLSGTANLASLGAALIVMLRSLSYGQALQGALANLSSSTPPIELLRKHLAAFEGARRAEGDDRLGHIGVLEARNVSFEYVPGHQVLKGVSFTIEPHEIIGIVGPSGSGKSTLVQLMLGLRSPTEGSILVDGRNISEFSRADWARRITFVQQEAHLITASIEDNIRFFRPDVGHDDVARAAELAQVHDDILKLPDGYNRQIGGEHARLSGGQAQRVSIARALVENPDVLIMDEPTSALDVRSEHLIRKTILTLRERMTIIVIAHRLSTLEDCDRIMVLQDGRLVAFDAPSVLERTSAFYREALLMSGMR